MVFPCERLQIARPERQGTGMLELRSDLVGSQGRPGRRDFRWMVLVEPLDRSVHGVEVISLGYAVLLYTLLTVEWIPRDATVTGVLTYILLYLSLLPHGEQFRELLVAMTDETTSLDVPL